MHCVLQRGLMRRAEQARREENLVWEGRGLDGGGWAGTAHVIYADDVS